MGYENEKEIKRADCGSNLGVNTCLGRCGICGRWYLSVLRRKKLEFDVAPIIENDRTLVPIRAIFEALGADVTWDQETKTAFMFSV